MKSKILILILLVITFYSCTKDNFGSNVPACSWSDNDAIAVDPIALSVPSNMSMSFMGTVPSDGIFRTLTHPLWKGTFYSDKNVAKIYGQLISDGSECTGSKNFSYAVDYGGNSNNIGGNYIKLTVPTQGFYGTAKMTILTDFYFTDTNASIAEYVCWAGSSSNPDFPTIYGAINGVRKTYDPSTENVILKTRDGSGCYYSNGNYICP